MAEEKKHKEKKGHEAKESKASEGSKEKKESKPVKQQPSWLAVWFRQMMTEHRWFRLLMLALVLGILYIVVVDIAWPTGVWLHNQMDTERAAAAAKAIQQQEQDAGQPPQPKPLPF